MTINQIGTDQAPTVPQLTNKTQKPEGVISKRAQQYVFVGIAVVIVLVAMFSSNRQKKPAKAQQAGVFPSVQDVNERKLSDFGSELSEQQRTAERAHTLAQLPPPSNPAPGTSRIGISASQLRSPQQMSPAYPADYASSYASPQYSDQERDRFEQRERERAYNSRFASNLAFVAEKANANPSGVSDIAQTGNSSASIPISQHEQAPKKPVNVNVNGAAGQPYVLFEGTILETALVNRLDGDFSGPVKVLLTNPVYSHDRQHVLVPEGSTVLGEVKQVQGIGQRRLAVTFHRLLMPDGYSVDLDQFKGLNQIGETGLKDEINNHYVQIFGASIALGVIAGAAEASANNAGIYESGADAYKRGTASSFSQSGTHILDRFLNTSPTLTIREGHRVKVYLTQDLLLPAYENHNIPPNI